MRQTSPKALFLFFAISSPAKPFSIWEEYTKMIFFFNQNPKSAMPLNHFLDVLSLTMRRNDKCRYHCKSGGFPGHWDFNGHGFGIPSSKTGGASRLFSRSPGHRPCGGGSRGTQAGLQDAPTVREELRKASSWRRPFRPWLRRA